MLSENSVLKRLPPNLEAGQLVLLDGIRHTAEISWLAFSRLDASLTWLADATPGDPRRNEVTIAAYMDAWSLVDAIDRFRGLWAIVGLQKEEKPSTGPTFAELSKPVRDIRNVSDHLAQRIDYVAAKGSPVMGLLTWITFAQNTNAECFSCALAAGTSKKANWQLVNPAGPTPQLGPSQRTGEIHLAAGEHRAGLSHLIPEMQLRIRQLEDRVEVAVHEHGMVGKQAGADYFIAMRGRFSVAPDGATNWTPLA
jgi:hypothetical protein